MSKSVHSTVRVGAVTITDKHGDLKNSRPMGVNVPLAKIAWMVKMRQENPLHDECDFSPIFDGSDILVCSCGRTQR
jgi:hypothetical protein